MRKFPFYNQLDQMDCGPSCIKMVAASYGKIVSIEYLREKSYITREGVSFLGLSEAAEAIGMRSLAAQINYQLLQKEAPFPCVVHWRQKHFIVVYKIKKDKVYAADPAFGLITYSKKEFLEGWLFNKKTDETTDGLALLLEPAPEFYEEEGHKEKKGRGIRFLFPYFRPYSKYFFQLFLGLLASGILQLIFPFLTQSLVDFGIKNQNIPFIYLVLMAQLMLFFSLAMVEVIRSWILLHIGSRINISLISDFLVKLMKLPLSFFDSKMMGDLLQRIDDHSRIEAFLSSSTLNVLFSLFNLVVFSAILIYYKISIFFIFIIGTAFYILWVLLFMKKRAVLDFKRHSQLSENRSSLIQLVQGMQEIKLNNSERRRRWEWEEIRVKLFKISLKALALSQVQSMGGSFINQLKNIMITFFSAEAVIKGDMTLGMMLAVQYIIGQLSEPVNQFVAFSRSAQDASLSLERLAEIHNNDNEEEAGSEKLTIISRDKTIHVTDLVFRYGGPNTPAILQGLDFSIPEGKVTAIVGASGSGKSTLLKLLLKFYPPTTGKIQVGNQNLSNISARVWREKCGAVMQDGFIFADTIARNITESASDAQIDRERLLHAVRVANIEDFIESLPLGYNTKISWAGISLSGGERQRILIARAVYKNPEFLFFDEATSSLDANNEKIIMGMLEAFYKGKTVVVIAHRLSTVKNADQVLVMEKGQIIERGTHTELTQLKGAYFKLVKNQLELDNN